MVKKLGLFGVVGSLAAVLVLLSATSTYAGENKVIKGVVTVQADEDGEATAVSVGGSALVFDAKAKVLASTCEGKTVEATVTVNDGKMTLVSYKVVTEEAPEDAGGADDGEEM